jgi:hypothetical protein
MGNNIADWESELQESLRGSPTDYQMAGALLSAVPGRVEWERFTTAVRDEWWVWSADASRWPNCLLVLYAGLAFFEYEDRQFWPKLSALVQRDITNNLQSEINRAFADAARKIGLRILTRARGGDYVGSAVYHIGVPISLWDGFLDVCAWALLQDEWQTLSETEWQDAMAGCAGGRIRLRKFLTDNREAANAFIHEMLDARRVLSEDGSLKISDIKQATLLRQEYFDEVPETAEFLRPSDPDSLFADRVRLFWDEQGCHISLNLPPVASDKLPASWRVGDVTQEAASTADALHLDADSFVSALTVELSSAAGQEAKRLRGLEPFGLFDDETNRFANPEREQLPVSRYTIISRFPLEDISRTGFSEEESANEAYELRDGTTCFLTRLYPTSNAPEATFTVRDKAIRLRFRPVFKIETRMVVGEGRFSAHFLREIGRLTVERLPQLFVAIPKGQFKNAGTVLQRKFDVVVDDAQAYVAYGRWERHHEDAHREFYSWCWSNKPVGKKLAPRTLHGFTELDRRDFEVPALDGPRTISVAAKELQLRFTHEIEIVKPFSGMESRWRNLPGSFLPWFLVCQMPDGIALDEMLLIQAMIAPASAFTAHSLFRALCRYANFGFLSRRGQKWRIEESRVAIRRQQNKCDTLYCGDPSILWGLYRHILSSNRNLQRRLSTSRIQDRQLPSDGGPDRQPRVHRVIRAGEQEGQALPIIEVVQGRRHPPCLRMVWGSRIEGSVRSYLEHRGVRVEIDLWRP